MNDRLQRRTLRRGIGQYTWALLLYYLIMNFAVSMAMEIQLIYRGFQSVIQGNDWELFLTAIEQTTEDVLYGNGWGYLVACGVAVVLIPVWKGKRFFAGIFETKQAMTLKTFLCLICLLLSGQMVFSILASIEEFILNLFGLSVLESMEMSSGGADTFSMFLYMGLGAPIVEEIVFRGMIMRGLQPYGKRFAMFAAAVLFGLFHGNIVQSPYAFVIGLVLSYTAMEYSILWSMVLHMLNNLVLGDMLTRITSLWAEPWADLFFFWIIAVSSIASVVILIRNRAEIRAYGQADRMDRRCLKAFVTAAPNLVLFVLMTISAVSMLFI